MIPIRLLIILPYYLKLTDLTVTSQAGLYTTTVFPSISVLLINVLSQQKTPS